MAVRKRDGSQREAIMARARRLFWEKGYSETSMRDIAEECGFRPANIYNFFSGKEEILYEILREEMEQIIEPVKHLEKDTDIDPHEQLRMVIDNHVRLTLGERRTSKLLFDTGLANLSPLNRKRIIEMRDTYNRIACGIIDRGVKAGLFQDIDVKLAVYSIASMIVRTRVWYSPQGRLSIDEIIDFIYQFALNGLSRVK